MMREDWLERRLREVPEVLADRVRDLAGSAPRTPEGLSNAALAGFELVARGC